MTIRKQWLLILFLVAILSVAINTFVLGFLTEKSFEGYVRDVYDDQVEKILEYSKDVLANSTHGHGYTSLEVDSYLVDPINEIRIYDDHGMLVLAISSTETRDREESRNRMDMMMNHMMGSQLEEKEIIDVIKDGEKLGSVTIAKRSSVEDSITSRLFIANLLSNSLKSILFVLIIAFIIGLFVSKRMSKELVLTALKAQGIELGARSDDINSRVKEIQIIERSLDSLKVKLDLKQRSRKKLVDELIHQSRTPLTIIKTHIEGYEDGVLDLNQEETSIILNEVDNITSIISNLSALIDAEKENEKVEGVNFDICELVSQITSGLRLQFEKKGIDLCIDCNKPIKVTSDKYKLSQVIYNVITNAYKYTPRGGLVSILVKSTDGKYRIEISDTGIGIKDEDKERVFDAYFRGNKNLETGDGIGLYVARENMKQIKGSIIVDSYYDKGSKFIIEFEDLEY